MRRFPRACDKPVGACLGPLAYASGFSQLRLAAVKFAELVRLPATYALLECPKVYNVDGQMLAHSARDLRVTRHTARLYAALFCTPPPRGWRLVEALPRRARLELSSGLEQ